MFSTVTKRDFSTALPDKTLAQKCEKVKGGKQSKEWLTVRFACSFTGEKLKPVVIGKAQKPRAFMGIDISQLPVHWRFNKKAWMTSKINVCLSNVSVKFFWAAGRRPYIVFTFTGSVRNVRNDVNIYICVMVRGRKLGGSKSTAGLHSRCSPATLM